MNGTSCPVGVTVRRDGERFLFLRTPPNHRSVRFCRPARRAPRPSCLQSSQADAEKRSPVSCKVVLGARHSEVYYMSPPCSFSSNSDTADACRGRSWKLMVSVGGSSFAAHSQPQVMAAHPQRLYSRAQKKVARVVLGSRRG
jgi:hypothetical protein